MTKKGFTLIELLIVSAVILVLLAFSTPLFRKTFVNLELRETVSTIGRLITLAQQKAVIEGAAHKISFNFEDKTYQLFGVLREGEEAKLVVLKDRFGRIFYIPKDVEIEGRFNEIWLYPDGRCDNGNAELPEQVSLRLTNKNGRVMTITTTGSLGNVTITEEKL